MRKLQRKQKKQFKYSKCWHFISLNLKCLLISYIYPTKIAFSCITLTTVTTRLARRSSKSGTLSASSRTSFSEIDANGILILFFKCARLYSTWLLKSITTISSGFSLIKLIKSFALIRGHLSSCKSFSSMPLISCDKCGKFVNSKF